MVSGDDIDPSRILSEKTALFLHVMDEGSPYNAIAAVLFEQLYAAVYSIADAAGGKLPRPVSILGDDGGTCRRSSACLAFSALGARTTCSGWAQSRTSLS
mgnify:CR=1 FL=1